MVKSVWESQGPWSNLFGRPGAIAQVYLERQEPLVGFIRGSQGPWSGLFVRAKGHVQVYLGEPVAMVRSIWEG